MCMWAGRYGGQAGWFAPPANLGACAAPFCHLPLLQKFNAMIYLPFREDARIVHMHGCVSACRCTQGWQALHTCTCSNAIHGHIDGHCDGHLHNGLRSMLPFLSHVLFVPHVPQAQAQPLPGVAADQPLRPPRLLHIGEGAGPEGSACL